MFESQWGILAAACSLKKYIIHKWLENWGRVCYVCCLEAVGEADINPAVKQITCMYVTAGFQTFDQFVTV